MSETYFDPHALDFIAEVRYLFTHHAGYYEHQHLSVRQVCCTVADPIPGFWLLPDSYYSSRLPQLFDTPWGLAFTAWNLGRRLDGRFAFVSPHLPESELPPPAQIPVLGQAVLDAHRVLRVYTEQDQCRYTLPLTPDDYFNWDDFRDLAGALHRTRWLLAKAGIAVYPASFQIL